MKSINVLFVVLLSAFVLVGCKKKAKETATIAPDTTKAVELTADQKAYKALAEATCECQDALLTLGAEAENVDAAKANELMKKIEAESAKANACMEKLGKKFEAQMKDENEAKAMEAMEKYCPKFAEVAKKAAAQSH